ncbi:MAG: 7-cyano-7-deazaguanine synthase QueC [Actinomycetia bacterium]|nr:7-cyano-7-deazaguanine synthase QueC [Actinomycetes bacterium]
MKKSIVLLSSGLDSLVNLSIADQKTDIELIITFDYGQKAANNEIENAKNIAVFYKKKHKVIKLDFFKEFAESSLLKDNELPPQIKEKDLKNNNLMERYAENVWIPNRNSIFINIAAGYAEYMNVDYIITGFNIEEAETFSDNSAQFVERMNSLFQYSVRKKIKLISYTLNLNKKEIVELGLKLKIPFEMIWSCYMGGEKMCGKCESCQRIKKSVRDTDVWKIMEERFEN